MPREKKEFYLIISTKIFRFMCTRCTQRSFTRYRCSYHHSAKQLAYAFPLRKGTHECNHKNCHEIFLSNFRTNAHCSFSIIFLSLFFYFTKSYVTAHYICRKKNHYQDYYENIFTLILYVQLFTISKIFPLRRSIKLRRYSLIPLFH